MNTPFQISNLNLSDSSKMEIQTFQSTTSIGNGIEIKASLDNQFRRFKLPNNSFNLLLNSLSDLFEFSKRDEFIIQYKDDDGDLITISSDMELQYAINKFAKDSCLRLYLIKKNPLLISVEKRFEKKKQKLIEKTEEKLLRLQEREQRVKERIENNVNWKPEMRFRRMCRTRKMLARFVKDVSIPDGTCLLPNSPFVKTWRFRNEGDIPWPKGSQLAFIGRNSDQMGGPDYVSIPDSITVNPGDEFDVSVPLKAPSKPGRYLGYWRMREVDGRKFGQRVWVKIDVIDPKDSQQTNSQQTN